MLTPAVSFHPPLVSQLISSLPSLHPKKFKNLLKLEFSNAMSCKSMFIESYHVSYVAYEKPLPKVSSLIKLKGIHFLNAF